MLRLRDIMTRDVLSMSPDFSIRDAMEFLAKHCVSGTPVLENGKVVGVVSASDLIAFAAALPPSRSDVDVCFRDAESPFMGSLDDHTVAEVMTETVHSLPSTTEVSVAAQFMRSARIHRVLAMEAGRLCGIVSMSDIAGAVADQRVTGRIHAFTTRTPVDRRA